MEGAWRNLPRCLRLCKLCGLQTEDEKHFLVDCPMYSFGSRRRIVDMKNAEGDGNLLHWILNPPMDDLGSRLKYIKDCVGFRLKWLSEIKSD